MIPGLLSFFILYTFFLPPLSENMVRGLSWLIATRAMQASAILSFDTKIGFASDSLYTITLTTIGSSSPITAWPALGGTGPDGRNRELSHLKKPWDEQQKHITGV